MLEEGDKCRAPDCEGKMGYARVVNCLCHISPPCNACLDNPLVCLDCGCDEFEALDLIRRPTESLTVKWGTIKDWNIVGPESSSILYRYLELGRSLSLAAHRDTTEQKALLCTLIDVLDAHSVYNEWTEKEMTKDEAKDYIMASRAG